jgi:adenylate kinase
LILVLFGPPGAGKGTQSLLLSKKINLTHVSTGDLLRSAIKDRNDLGLKAKKFVDVGELVPDDIMIGLIKNLITSKSESGFLFDGFPRTVDQARALDSMLKETGRQIKKAIFLEVPTNLLLDRLTGRRICTKCGASFHITMKPPHTENVCDLCHGALEQRKDDRAEVIENRLEVYDKNTHPLKSYYQEAEKFVSVNGVGEPVDVLSRIREVIK